MLRPDIESSTNSDFIIRPHDSRGRSPFSGSKDRGIDYVMEVRAPPSLPLEYHGTSYKDVWILFSVIERKGAQLPFAVFSNSCLSNQLTGEHGGFLTSC